MNFLIPDERPELTERKYTDEEVIKALECCAKNSTYDECCECLYVECSTQKGCVGELMEDAINLINRQKAEIERLNAVSEICGDCHKKYAEKIERAKSEAMKEFAERLKEKYKNHLV